MAKGFITTFTVVCALVIAGVIYYSFFRHPDSALFLSFIPDAPFFHGAYITIPWINWLPTFIHVVALSLLTSLIMGNQYALFSCLFWAAINIAFEIGQALPANVVQQFPEKFYIQHFFASGVYDPADILAAIAGGVVAWSIIKFLAEGSNEQA